MAGEKGEAVQCHWLCAALALDIKIELKYNRSTLNSSLVYLLKSASCLVLAFWVFTRWTGTITWLLHISVAVATTDLFSIPSYIPYQLISSPSVAFCPQTWPLCCWELSNLADKNNQNAKVKGDRKNVRMFVSAPPLSFTFHTLTYLQQLKPMPMR